MSEWITDRLPTRNDVNPIYDLVWVALDDGEVNTRHWYQVQKGQPWQPFQVPAPYVKPKRWRVEWNVDTWVLVDDHLERSYWCGLKELGRNGDNVAQRIEDLFNEVMP